MKERITSGGYDKRLEVPEQYRSWNITYDGYSPINYQDNIILTNGIEAGWADPEDISDLNIVERYSHAGDIVTDDNGFPLHPNGRQGLAGRGELGKWGPNLAEDAITIIGQANGDRRVLLVKRRSGHWAWPGGMKDPGELPGQTAVREQFEETGISLPLEIYKSIYKGIVKDPRDTDNSWMETEAFYTVLGNDDEIGELSPEYGEVIDAGWFDVDKVLEEKRLYANHGKFLLLALKDIG